MSEQQDNLVNQPHPWLEDIKKDFDLENSTLQIYAGSAKVYEQVGNEVTLNKLEGNTAQKVQQALETPQELEGSVRIMLDGEKVFHVKQGELLENKLSLVQTATAKQGVETEIQAETKLENQPETVVTTSQIKQIQPETVAVQPEVLSAVVCETEKELPQPEFVPQSWDDIRNLIAENQQNPDLAENAIFKLLAYQSQQLNELQQQLDALQKRKPPLNIQVNKFFDSLKHTAANSIQEVKQRAQQLPQDISQLLGNKATQIQETVVERVNAVKQDVIDKVDDLKVTVVNQVNVTKEAAMGKVAEIRDSVDLSLADLSAKALDSAHRWLVNKFGKELDGSGDKVWKGKDYTFTTSGQNTSIFNKSGQEIARDGKLTLAATEQDASKLTKLPQDVLHLTQKLHHQSQVAGVSLKR